MNHIVQTYITYLYDSLKKNGGQMYNTSHENRINVYNDQFEAYTRNKQDIWIDVTPIENHAKRQKLTHNLYKTYEHVDQIDKIQGEA